MNGIRFLLGFDILGFENLAREIASKKGIDPRMVRQRFIEVVKERVSAAVTKGWILESHYDQADSWVVVVATTDAVFQTIAEVLEHNTGYQDYERLPLEIAVGNAEFDRSATFGEGTLILENGTIAFLKTELFKTYRDWHKEQEGQPIKSTFVVLTESGWTNLDPFARSMWKSVQVGRLHFFVADAAKVHRRGQVLTFLDKIGHSGSRLYDNIDTLYVPPIEYPNIRMTLQDKRAVFIVGTQEYGKTYTAVRLLWEYYEKGYEPRWIKGGELFERAAVRENLEEIRRELKQGHIVYFEDPFGKVQYEKRESLEREIGAVRDVIAQSVDAYAIITSREEVFKEFEEESLAEADLAELEQSLNIHKPSYDYKARVAMALGWAEREGCRWLNGQDSKRVVLLSLADETSLPTPLSIRAFALATVNAESDQELEQKINEKSVQTQRAFAQEIAAMSDDKVAFLLFPFIGRFGVHFAEKVYGELVAELVLKDAWTFGRLLEWFRDDKVKIADQGIELSHPSYGEAIHRCLELGRKRDIFHRLLLKLAEKSEAGSAVALTTVNEFSMLPEDMAAVLLKLVEADAAASIVALAISKRFDELPPDVGHQLLKKLATKRGTAETVTSIILEHFDKLPPEIRDLLFQLAENNRTAGDVASAIVTHFGRLPPGIEELLFRLADKHTAVANLASSIACGYNSLPEDIRKLLFSLAEREDAARAVARAVADKSHKLPDNVRNELLLKLANKDKAAWGVARAVAANFQNVPTEVQELLFKLAEKDRAALFVARAVSDNFDKLPEYARNQLLIELSQKDMAARTLAAIVDNNFAKLPEDLRNTMLHRWIQRSS